MIATNYEKRVQGNEANGFTSRYSRGSIAEVVRPEPQLMTLIARQMHRKCRRGWVVDFHPMSYDTTDATARAYRLLQRIRGQRMTMEQALND
jgi:hypothetical protein